MHTVQRWIICAVVVMTTSACGDDKSSTSDGGTSQDAALSDAATGTTPDAATGTTPDASTSSMVDSGSAADCEDLLPQQECADCQEANCCSQLLPCVGVEGCRECALGDEEKCTLDNQDEADALLTCMRQACPNECLAPEPACEGVPATPPSGGTCITVYGLINCNPVTGDGCDTAAGQACDRSGTQSFTCYPGPNEHELCEACSSDVGYCRNGLACVVGTCAKFCCSNADCGPNGECALGLYSNFDELGICVKK